MGATVAAMRLPRTSISSAVSMALCGRLTQPMAIGAPTVGAKPPDVTSPTLILSAKMGAPSRAGRRPSIFRPTRFEPGRTYSEAEVNETLRAFYDDYAALRRYLVDEGFLTRDANTYWRTGGTFAV